MNYWLYPEKGLETWLIGGPVCCQVKFSWCLLDATAGHMTDSVSPRLLAAKWEHWITARGVGSQPACP